MFASRATLTLPPVLNKDQRLVWHQAAQALQLHSSSQVSFGVLQRSTSWNDLWSGPGPGRDHLLQLHVLYCCRSSDLQRNCSGTCTSPIINLRHHQQPPACINLQGIGSSRFLTISTEPIASSATDNGSSTPVPDIKALAERSRQIWEWCQQEGGRFWDISSSEIKEMLASEVRQRLGLLAGARDKISSLLSRHPLQHDPV